MNNETSQIINLSLVHHTIETQKPDTLWIAYSGGLDSHVLLHQIHCLRASLDVNIAAIHINHSLSPNARDWAKHCQQVCHNFNIPIIIKTITIAPKKQNSLEALAREGRYQAFKNQMKPNDILMTAHHADDQTETVLLQWLRGSGPTGLSGMPEQQWQHGFCHLRPLLHQSRDELNQYARTHQLQWIDDESNQNLVFRRNFLRQRIVPLLKEHWPSINKTAMRSAKLCKQNQDLINDHCDLLLQSIENEHGQLCISSLAKQSLGWRNNIFRRWLQKHKTKMPNEKHLVQFNHLLNARSDACPTVYWDIYCLKRYRDAIFLCLKENDTHKQENHPPITWDLKNTATLPGNRGELQCKKSTGGVRPPQTGEEVSIRFYQANIRFKMNHSRYSQSLKNIFQQWGIPPWKRHLIPLIFYNHTCVSIVGYANAEKYQLTPSASDKKGLCFYINNHPNNSIDLKE